MQNNIRNIPFLVGQPLLFCLCIPFTCTNFYLVWGVPWNKSVYNIRYGCAIINNYLKTQCAAVSTAFGAIKEPPQKEKRPVWFVFFSKSATIQGNSPYSASSVLPTILKSTPSKFLMPHGLLRERVGLLGFGIFRGDDVDVSCRGEGVGFVLIGFGVVVAVCGWGTPQHTSR